MKKITIAFDVDGTLANSKKEQVPNERIRTLLVTLHSFKNVKIVVWSGSGEFYASQIANTLGISKYVDRYAAKQTADFIPDIAIDDVQDCELGRINLIVREK